MKKFLMSVFILISLMTGGCFAQNIANHQNEYKTLKCNDASGACIIRDKILKYGIADKNGNIILPVEYSNISIAKDQNNNFILQKDSKTGIADSNGKIIIPCEYLTIRKLANTDDKYLIQPDWAEKFGIADMISGHIDIKPQYDNIAVMRNGTYLVEMNGNQGVINKNFKLIIPAQYYHIMLYKGDRYYRLHKEVNIKNKEGFDEAVDRFGIADSNGRLVVPVECTYIDKNYSSNYQKFVKDGLNYIFDLTTGNISSK